MSLPGGPRGISGCGTTGPYSTSSPTPKTEAGTWPPCRSPLNPRGASSSEPSPRTDGTLLRTRSGPLQPGRTGRTPRPRLQHGRNPQRDPPHPGRSHATVQLDRRQAPPVTGVDRESSPDLSAHRTHLPECAAGAPHKDAGGIASTAVSAVILCALRERGFAGHRLAEPVDAG